MDLTFEILDAQARTEWGELLKANTNGLDTICISYKDYKSHSEKIHDIQKRARLRTGQNGQPNRTGTTKRRIDKKNRY